MLGSHFFPPQESQQIIFRNDSRSCDRMRGKVVAMVMVSTSRCNLNASVYVQPDSRVVALNNVLPLFPFMEGRIEDNFIVTGFTQLNNKKLI